MIMRGRWLETVRLGIGLAMLCPAAACDRADSSPGCPPTPVCTPNEVEECACLQDHVGTRVCDSDGCGFSECACCAPDCSGRECGPDPVCGVSCGECAEHEDCGADGTCACRWPCEEACCGPHERCVRGMCVFEEDFCHGQDECPSNLVCSAGRCRPDCVQDADCPADQVCSGGRCQPAACTSREDCAVFEGCRVCVDQVCRAEPPVCSGDRDCCVGHRCNFGACVEVTPACEHDSDCLDPELPRCVAGSCRPECDLDIGCPPCEHCVLGHCERFGCYSQPCDPGFYCDATTCGCVPGCDSDDDCTPPEICRLPSHGCGSDIDDCCGNACQAPATCDSLSCACAEPCVRGDCVSGACSLYPNTTCDAASGKCVACPAGFTCDAATGQCVCAGPSCPASSTCNATTGMCEPDQGICDPTCETPEACSFYDVCVTPGSGQDGTPCFSDAECDSSQGLLCDGSLFCIGCMTVDPTFAPGFVCREECSLLMGGCTNPAYTCKYRHTDLKGLCVPEDVP